MSCMPSGVNTETDHLMLKIIIFSIGMILICSIVTFANETGKNRGEGTQVPKKQSNKFSRNTPTT